jgi:ABC-type Mn2+/Zn2+ transport system ATPase subunit
MSKTFKFNDKVYFNAEYKIRFDVDENVIFKRGDFVRFFADNGVGKTAFFKEVHRYSSEAIIFADTVIYYVPQNYEDNIYPGRRVRNFFLEYLKNGEDSQTNDAKDFIDTFFQDNNKFLLKAYPKKQRDNLDAFDIEEFYSRRMDKLSGGQKRLLYMLREFLILRITNKTKEKVLILDEPFNDIDLSNLEFIKKLIENVRKDIPSLTIFISTHLQLLDGLNQVIFLKKDQDNVRVSFPLGDEPLNYYIKNRYNFE